MATVTVTQPAHGSTSTISASMSSYTVRWTASTSSDRFGGFRVICHACGRTLYSSGDNPASFDLSSLESSGHPGPFEIVTDTNDYGDICLKTDVATGQGTTSPVLQWLTAGSDGYATGHISATPDTGWEFKGWSFNSPSAAITSTSASLSVRLRSQGGDAIVTYYAHFEQIKFKPYLGFDISNVPEPNNVGFDRSDWWKRSYFFSTNERGTGYNYNLFFGKSDPQNFYYMGRVVNKNGVVLKEYDYGHTSPFAHLTATPSGGFVYGNTVTAQFVIDDMSLWNAFGFKFLGWQISYWRYDGSGGSTTAYVDDYIETTTQSGDREVSFVADKISLEKLMAGDTYSIFAVIGVTDMVKLTFLSQPITAAKLSVVNASYVDPVVNGNAGKVVAWARIGASLILRVNQILLSKGFVHGWSEQLTSAAGGVVSKSYIMPYQDAQVMVWICSHLLVCTDDWAHLECKPPELLYACNVPPGTTVYP